MKWILLIMFLTSAFEEISGFTTPNKTCTWKEANETCTLATPDITFTGEGIFVKINSTRITGSDSYWVGYTQVRQLFEYIGCTKESDVATHSIKNFTVRSAGIHGLCYSACETSVIGLKDKNCYCFNTRPEVNDTQTNCNKTYDRIPCGGESSVSLFSAATFALENITNVNSGNGEKCVAMYQKSLLHVLKKCTENLQPKCQGKSMGNDYIPIRENRTWSKSQDLCFSIQGKTYKHGSAIQGNIDKTHRQTIDNGDRGGLLWTTMFMSKSVIKKSNEPGTPVGFGYIYKDNGTMTLQFAQNSKMHKAVCAAPVATTYDITTVTEITNTVQLNQKQLSNDDNQSNDTGIGEILLYIFVALVVTVIPVVAVVCYRNRAKLKTCRQKPTLSREYSEVQDAYEDTEYIFTVPLDSLEGTQRQQSNPINEGAYDVSSATGRVRDVDNHTESENVYHKLNTRSNDTYDHTNLTNTAVQSGKTFSGNDDVLYSTSQTRDYSYDTTLPKQREPVVTDNVYSHANNDETYSQTNRIANSKSSPTDNIYN